MDLANFSFKDGFSGIQSICNSKYFTDLCNYCTDLCNYFTDFVIIALIVVIIVLIFVIIVPIFVIIVPIFVIIVRIFVIIVLIFVIVYLYKSPLKNVLIIRNHGFSTKLKNLKSKLYFTMNENKLCTLLMIKNKLEFTRTPPLLSLPWRFISQHTVPLFTLLANM